ncbi:hypothetical protein AX769_13930 [Frondihabitans sp. PAMC 28766]|nr:hypothetical protein AX769_13930 [Frondihabitans sp. PAMC 28766]
MAAGEKTANLMSMRIRVDSLDREPLSIFLEPWGTQYSLDGDDWLDVEVPDTQPPLEVSHHAEGISLSFATEEMRLITKKGRILRP